MMLLGRWDQDRLLALRGATVMVNSHGGGANFGFNPVAVLAAKVMPQNLMIESFPAIFEAANA